MSQKIDILKPIIEEDAYYFDTDTYYNIEYLKWLVAQIEKAGHEFFVLRIEDVGMEHDPEEPFFVLRCYGVKQ